MKLQQLGLAAGIVFLVALVVGAMIFSGTGGRGCPFAACASGQLKPEAPAAATVAAPEAEKLEWLTDWPAALAKAKAEKKVLFVDFTGSDWCPWCIRLDKEVLATPEFAAWVRVHAIPVKIDFPKALPQSKAIAEQNQKLANTYQVSGFPTILLVDENGRELARTGYRQGGAEEYLKHLNTLLQK